MVFFRTTGTGVYTYYTVLVRTVLHMIAYKETQHSACMNAEIAIYTVAYPGFSLGGCSLRQRAAE